MQGAAGLTHHRVGTADRVEEDTVELLPWRLEPIPWTTAVAAEWIEAARTGPGHPGSLVTGEPGGSNSLGDAKLGEERLDARRQRLSRPVPGKYLTLENHNAKTVARTPERTGRPSRAASHDHDVHLRTRKLAHGLVRREVMLPGAILAHEDIRQVGVGDSLLLDPHQDATHILRGGLHPVPLKEVEAVSGIALETDTC